MQISRRQFLKTTGYTFGAAALTMSGIALHEPHDYQITRLDVQLPRLPRALDGLRLVQITDIHFGDFTYEQHIQRVVDLVNAEKPDIFICTGDFITAAMFGNHPEVADKAWPCAKVFQGVEATQGRFAVLGNHDYESHATTVAEALDFHGFVVLRNEATPVEASGGRLWLAGVDDVLSRKHDLEKTLKHIPANECRIVAVHEPDYADTVAKKQVDFQISGHTHGGQIRFPVVGPLYLPRLGQKYVMGMYRVGNLQLYTNRGVGVIHMPARLLCPPEIAVFTLRAA